MTSEFAPEVAKSPKVSPYTKILGVCKPIASLH